MKRAVEMLYADSCSIYEGTEHFSEITKQTSFVWEEVAAGVPCRISFGSAVPAAVGDAVTAISQTIKLFLTPDIRVKPGSRIVVTRGGSTTEYRASGQPALYTSHQEVLLELLEGYS